MSESNPSKVFLFDNSDPAMQQAYQNARSTFRYFWREVAWERRRIIPGLDLASVKAPFSDGPNASRSDNPDVEHMWLNEVDFDGQFVSGVLINSPNWLTSVKAGDPARIPLAEIGDWMYATSGEVFGAHTVNLMRSRMSSRERKDHDEAWGLDFGDPNKIRLVPEPRKGGGILKNWFGKQQPVNDEHPMSENAAPAFKEQLAKDPSILEYTDDQGWTQLHHLALAGSFATVKVFLESGADPDALTNNGVSPLQLARLLGWEKVVALLINAGAR